MPPLLVDKCMKAFVHMKSNRRKFILKYRCFCVIWVLKLSGTLDPKWLKNDENKSRRRLCVKQFNLEQSRTLLQVF